MSCMEIGTHSKSEELSTKRLKAFIKFIKPYSKTPVIKINLLLGIIWSLFTIIIQHYTSLDITKILILSSVFFLMLFFVGKSLKFHIQTLRGTKKLEEIDNFLNEAENFRIRDYIKKYNKSLTKPLYPKIYSNKDVEHLAKSLLDFCEKELEQREHANKKYRNLELEKYHEKLTSHFY